MAVCGTGMGSFAGLLKSAGHDVSGSDQNVYPPMSTQLEREGIRLLSGYKPENLEPSPDLVVVGNAIRKDNPEAVAMRERELWYASFPEALSELFLLRRVSMVVAGTHGKTTTSSLLAWCLSALGKDPGFLVGGVLENFGSSYRLGNDGGPFVVEGDEYDTAYFDKGPKFLHYRPFHGILTSVEFDHADIYRDLEHVRSAFRGFVELLPEGGTLLWCCDGEHVGPIADLCPARRLGYSTRGDPRAAWNGEILSADKDGMQFAVRHGSERAGVFRSMLVGEHNLANLLAVCALLLELDHRPEHIAEALAGYQGVKRRQTVFAEPRGITLIDDFAHHPTAVRETIAATRLRFGTARRLWAVFEPRTNTSRRNWFQADYVTAFDGADRVLVAPVHAMDSIPESERFDPSRLVRDIAARGQEAWLAPSVDGIVERVAAEARPGDIVLILSNGGFGGIYGKLPAAIRALEEGAPTSATAGA
jgi:UDP-N-acetylmuramate: L-alanyl-gamma-D-glutamyl-meso-diaminopimelate ligase